MNDEKPLIWTSKGNVPIEDLVYTYHWLESAEGTTFIEEYHLNGELVKSNSNSFLKKGIDLFPEQAE